MVTPAPFWTALKKRIHLILERIGFQVFLILTTVFFQVVYIADWLISVMPLLKERYFRITTNMAQTYFLVFRKSICTYVSGNKTAEPHIRQQKLWHPFLNSLNSSFKCLLTNLSCESFEWYSNWSLIWTSLPLHIESPLHVLGITLKAANEIKNWLTNYIVNMKKKYEKSITSLHTCLKFLLESSDMSLWDFYLG